MIYRSSDIDKMTSQERADLADELDSEWYAYVCETDMPEPEFIQGLKDRAEIDRRMR